MEDQTININEKGRVPIFKQICRTCLCEAKESDNQLGTRLLILNTPKEIKGLIEEATGVQIVDSDFLPNHICERCFKNLTAWYRFRSQTQSSNEVLQKYLKKLNTALNEKTFSVTTDLTIHTQGENLNVLPTQNVTQIQDFQISVISDKPEVLGIVIHCDSCKMTFTNQVDFLKHKEDHIKSVKVQKPFKCDVCHKSFAFRNGKHNHMKICHQRTIKRIYECKVCEKRYNSRTGLVAHNSKPCIPAALKEKCKSQQFNARNNELRELAEKVIQETKMCCALCKKDFATHAAFINHYSMHRKDRKCPICQKEFDGPKILERHVRMHMGEKPYCCPICSRSFYERRSFRTHVYDHGKREWAYKCKVCYQEFLQGREFDNHMVGHLEEENKALENPKPNYDNKIETDLGNYQENDSDSDTSQKNTEKETLMEFSIDIIDCKQEFMLNNSEAMEDEKDIDIYNEGDSNIATDIDVKNVLYTKIESDFPNCQAPSQLVKVEKDAETEAINNQEIKMDFPTNLINSKQHLQLIKTQLQVQSNFQLKTDHEVSNELSSFDNSHSNTNDTTENTEINIAKQENPTLDNSSSSSEEVVSTSSKTNDQTSKIPEEYSHSQKLLDECMLKCHIPGCETKSSRLTDVWAHFSKVHLNKRKPYTCSLCNQKFKSMRPLRLHIKQYYSYKCPVCFKLKSNSSELKKHTVRCHSTDKPFKCSKCEQKFNGANALKIHESIHTDKKEFVCEVCSKDFFSYNGLYLHSKSHKDIKELQCPVCSRQLSSKDRLKRHVENKTCGKKLKT